MDEWLKRHTYIVCGTLERAKHRALWDIYKLPPSHWEMQTSLLRIVGPEVYQYVSVYQVLHSFDAVSDVDLFEPDDTCSTIPKDELKKVIDVLYKSRMKTDRDKWRVKWLKEHDWGL